ncbi:MAG TPA: response regulator [Chloroflexaceae bacterium]|nr:response regulator [Chloroflexaceae bacterium]
MTTILVVEDEYAVAELLRDSLTEEGYTVLVCADGRAALETLAAQHVDLILSDVMMPRMDGRALVQALRANPRYQATPIILMSAGHGNVDPARDGFDAYISKPFNLYKLLATVAELLARGAPPG